jgi:hypothetical protein
MRHKPRQVRLVHGDSRAKQALDTGERDQAAPPEFMDRHDADFPARLFTYNYRLYDRYRRPVATLAVLADDGENWKPTHFGYQLFGCEMGIRFPTVKLLDYADQVEALLADTNPFALVTAAHLFTRKTKGDPEQRYAAKWRLAKLLYERNWDKQRIIDLFSVIDWLMRLPTDLEKRLMDEVYTLERNVTMPYVTSAERFGIEKGLQQGLQQGLLQGRQEGEAALLQSLLARRFGALPDAFRIRLASATVDQLESWAIKVLDAQSLEEIFDQR